MGLDPHCDLVLILVTPGKEGYSDFCHLHFSLMYNVEERILANHVELRSVRKQLSKSLSDWTPEEVNLYVNVDTLRRHFDYLKDQDARLSQETLRLSQERLTLSQEKLALSQETLRLSQERLTLSQGKLALSQIKLNLSQIKRKQMAIETMRLDIERSNTGSAKRRRTTLEPGGVIPDVTPEYNGSFLRLPRAIVEKISLLERDLILYLRKSLLDQIKFLDVKVMAEGRIGSVLGPPGSGKSVTAFAFACQKAAEGWSVTWVGNLSEDCPYFIRFHSGAWFHGITDRLSITDEVREICESLSDHDHLVLLDGYMFARDPDSSLSRYLSSWCAQAYRSNKISTRRRLAKICSMASVESRAGSP